MTLRACRPVEPEAKRYPITKLQHSKKTVGYFPPKDGSASGGEFEIYFILVSWVLEFAFKFVSDERVYFSTGDDPKAIVRDAPGSDAQGPD